SSDVPASVLAEPAADPPTGSFVEARLAQPPSIMAEPTAMARMPRFKDSVLIAIPFRVGRGVGAIARSAKALHVIQGERKWARTGAPARRGGAGDRGCRRCRPSGPWR